MSEDIIKFQKSIFDHFLNEHNKLLQNIKEYLTIDNIELLNYFKKNFNSLLFDIKDMNKLLQKDPNSEIVREKINQYLSINRKINQLLPALIMETI